MAVLVIMGSMSEWIKLKAEDGHELGAYVARPKDKAVGALVLLQEIFGVNAHIRSVADGYARDGYLVVAPAIFDRIEKHVELKYEGEDVQKAMSFFSRLNMENALLDVAAALDYARSETKRKTG